MIAPRVIPVLQINGDGWLVKTRGYTNPRYLGDPINAVKIFNEKQVDELIVVDITTSRSHGDPAYNLLGAIASEAFMPVSYGGGVRTLSHARSIIGLGVEKVLVNSALVTAPDAVAEIAAELGSQSVVASVDVRRDHDHSLHVVYASGRKDIDVSVEDFARRAVALGAGEVIVSAVDREGAGAGYDLEAVKRVASAVDVPVVSLGGARTEEHFAEALAAGASAVAAGSRFVFYGRLDAVLITYPEPEANFRLASKVR